MQFESKKLFQKGSQGRFLDFLVEPPPRTMGVQEAAEDIRFKTQRSHEELGALNKQSNSCIFPLEHSLPCCRYNPIKIQSILFNMKSCWVH